MPRAARSSRQESLGKKLLGPFMVALALFYLTYHSLSGDRGIYALLKEQRRLEALKLELQEVSAKRATLEHRVTLMSSASLDPDLMDEQARRVLGVAAQDEVMIPVPMRGAQSEGVE